MDSGKMPGERLHFPEGRSKEGGDRGEDCRGKSKLTKESFNRSRRKLFRFYGAKGGCRRVRGGAKRRRTNSIWLPWLEGVKGRCLKRRAERRRLKEPEQTVPPLIDENKQQRMRGGGGEKTSARRKKGARKAREGKHAGISPTSGKRRLNKKPA